MICEFEDFKEVKKWNWHCWKLNKLFESSNVETISKSETKHEEIEIMSKKEKMCYRTSQKSFC